MTGAPTGLPRCGRHRPSGRETDRGVGALLFLWEHQTALTVIWPRSVRSPGCRSNRSAPASWLWSGTAPAC